jgi:hypothetical protein
MKHTIIALMVLTFASCAKEEAVIPNAITPDWTPIGLYQIENTLTEIEIKDTTAHNNQWMVLRIGQDLTKKTIKEDSAMLTKMDKHRIFMYKLDFSTYIGTWQWTDTSYNHPIIRTHNGHLLKLVRK